MSRRWDSSSQGVGSACAQCEGAVALSGNSAMRPHSGWGVAGGRLRRRFDWRIFHFQAVSAARGGDNAAFTRTELAAHERARTRIERGRRRTFQDDSGVHPAAVLILHSRVRSAASDPEICVGCLPGRKAVSTFREPTDAVPSLSSQTTSSGHLVVGDDPRSALHWYDFLCPFCCVAQHRTAIFVRQHARHAEEHG